ncbi:unnamed protein product [Peronospora belbahrii]|uniref:Elicitin n=1 Tax=Peronospora belbahrii TaxID=622444 RepID=A0AAU9KQG4_9STRA|nr:unnamed protein product [Peronospora belbahrii]CAH0515698.1 unnamed protein product [Peronospora belbahrii]
MQLSTFLLIAAASAITAVYAAESCDMDTIQNSLLLNGTTWHENCAAATGMDVFAMSTFPTNEEALTIFQSRDCVNYLNQLNQQANTQIQCETQVGNQTIVLAELLTDLLMGKSSNKTKDDNVGSGSMSGSVSLSASDSASGSASGNVSGQKLRSGSEDSSKAVANSQESSIDGFGSSAGVTMTPIFNVAWAAATTVLAFAL